MLLCIYVCTSMYLHVSYDTQILMGMESNCNFQTLLVEMQNDAATVEDHLLVSYKVKYTPTIWSIYLHKSNKKLSSYKTWIFRKVLFIITKKLQITKMPFNWVMNTQLFSTFLLLSNLKSANCWYNQQCGWI